MPTSATCWRRPRAKSKHTASPSAIPCRLLLPPGNKVSFLLAITGQPLLITNTGHAHYYAKVAVSQQQEQGRAAVWLRDSSLWLVGLFKLYRAAAAQEFIEDGLAVLSGQRSWSSTLRTAHWNSCAHLTPSAVHIGLLCCLFVNDSSCLPL